MQWSYLDLWHVTQHERFPTRFSYLKGSSMELFTLEPTSKIDFSCNTVTAHLKRASEEISRLWAVVVFNTEFLQFSMPRSSIYRLGAQMTSGKIYMGAIRTVDMGRPDRQLYDKIFWEFRGEIFPV